MGTMVEGLIVDPPGKRETSTSTATCTCINALKFAHKYFEYRGQENVPAYLQGQLYAQIAEAPFKTRLHEDDVKTIRKVCG